MKNPIKLILASVCVLLAGCGESADLKQSLKEGDPAAGKAEPASRLLQAASVGFVAGLAPNQRPAGAPAIKAFAQSAQWRARFVSGIGEPVPPGLGFVESQGAWYTPFNQPGMPGYYDLRNWHSGGTRDLNNAGQ